MNLRPEVAHAHVRVLKEEEILRGGGGRGNLQRTESRNVDYVRAYFVCGLSRVVSRVWSLVCSFLYVVSLAWSLMCCHFCVISHVWSCMCDLVCVVSHVWSLLVVLFV